MPYPPTIREEELKNRVAAAVFGAFDCTRILGAVDFCVAAKGGDEKVVSAMKPIFAITATTITHRKEKSCL